MNVPKGMRLDWPSFSQGFRAMFPFWLGAAPFAAAYVLAAQKAGLNAVEIQWMSLTVYSAPAQMAILQSISADTTLLTLIFAGLAVSFHHLLYGLSLARRMTLSLLEKSAAAYFLTDGAYGVTIASGDEATFSFLLGAELSMFAVWNLSTAITLLLGRFVISPPSELLGFTGPLTFFLLVVSVVKSRWDLAVAMLSAVGTLFCLSIQPGSATIFIVAIGSAGIGALLATSRNNRFALKTDIQ